MIWDIIAVAFWLIFLWSAAEGTYRVASGKNNRVDSEKSKDSE